MPGSAIEFFTSVCTDFALLPALFQILKHRRHFDVFIAVFQLVSAFMFNLSSSIDSTIFLSTLDWHFVNDVLTLTYVLLILLHITDIPNEDNARVLKYIALAFAWIFKLRDEWDSGFWEGALIVGYVCLAIYYNAVVKSAEAKRFDAGSVQIAATSLGIGSIFFLVDIVGGADDYGLLSGIMHIFGGCSAYFWLKSVPAQDAQSLPTSFV